MATVELEARRGKVRPPYHSIVPRHWESWIPAIFLALIAAHASYFKNGIDFHVFLEAANRLLQGKPIYQLADTSPFKYLPVVASCFVPFAILPERLAHTFWMFISAAALFRLLKWCSAELHQGHAWLPSALVLAFAAPFIFQELALGQSDAILLGVMAESEARADQRPRASGLLWAIVCLVKPPYLIFGLIAIAWRQWVRLKWLLLGIGMGMALGFLLYRGSYWEQLHGWATLLRATSTPAAICNVDNQSLFAMVCTYWLGADQGIAFLTAVGIVALAIAALGAGAVHALFGKDARLARFLASATAFYLTALLSPLGWQSNLVSAIPLLFFLVASWGSPQVRKTARPLIALAFAVLATTVVLNYDVVGRSTFQRLLYLRYYGCAVLFAAVVAFFTAVKRTAPAGAK